jgi:hypothetical protein
VVQAERELRPREAALGGHSEVAQRLLLVGRNAVSDIERLAARMYCASLCPWSALIRRY